MEELLRQCGLAGVGVADDRKRPATTNRGREGSRVGAGLRGVGRRLQGIGSVRVSAAPKPSAQNWGQTPITSFDCLDSESLLGVPTRSPYSESLLGVPTRSQDSESGLRVRTQSRNSESSNSESPSPN